MKRIFTRVAVTAFALPLVVAIVASSWIGHKTGPREATNAHRLSSMQRARLTSLTVPFVANKGRLGREVAFMAPTFAGTAFVTRRGALVLSLPAPHGHHKPGWALVETPVGGRAAGVHGVQPMPARVNLFQGNRSRDWYSGLRTFAQVDLGAVWRGIHYSVRAHGDNVERRFTLRPGADVAAIRMRVKGVSQLRVHDDRLVADTGNGPVTLSRPRAWQRIDGRRLAVPVSYTVTGDEYGFTLGRYDHNRPIVIDPIIRSTYLGGANGSTAANGMQVLAANGDIYLAGSTTSPAFPGTTGGAQPASGGSEDAFVAELSPNMSQLLQATYLGGSGDDTAMALAVAPASTSMAGDVYVVGTTRSADFPVTSGSAQTTCGGGSAACQSSGDAFVSALSPDLKTLIASSYLGGSGIDEGHAIAIAPHGSPDAGQVYVAGRTLSTNFPFVSSTSAQPAPAAASNYQAFVARFTANLGSANATYLGGSGSNEAYALTVAPAPATSGLVYVAGDTSSADFPCTNSGAPAPAGGGVCASGGGVGAQSTPGGSFDAFVSELNPGLSQIMQSTYFGGTDVDSADWVGIAPSGSAEAGQVYIAGLTYSADIPGTVGAAQSANAGNDDGFIARMSSNLSSLGQATYVGGSGDDAIQALVFSGNQVYAAGTTGSSDLPCTGANGTPVPTGSGACAQQTPGIQYAFGGGGTDGFVSLLGANLQTWAQSTYYGGNSTDSVNGLSLAPASSSFAGDVLLSGTTQSTDLRSTSGSVQATPAGSASAYAAALTPSLAGPQISLDMTVNAPSTVPNKSAITQTIVITNQSTSSSDQATGVMFYETLANTTTSGQILYDSSTPSQGTCSNNNGFISCQLGTLAANGGSATITVKGTAAAVGAAQSLFTTKADQALDPATSTAHFSRTITITKKPSSSGGGGFRWPVLLMLAFMSLLVAGTRSWRARTR